MGWKGTDPSEWAERQKKKQLAIFRIATQELYGELALPRTRGGKTPVVTGNLVRSLLAQKGSMPATVDSKQSFTGQDIGPVLLDAKIGDKIYLGFQAAYARRVNYGFVGEDSLGRTYNQSGAGFVEQAAANWPIIVELAVEHVNKRMG